MPIKLRWNFQQSQYFNPLKKSNQINEELVDR